MKDESKAVPSDVVELIIAVDLNPSDPEEPLNVNDVKVTPKGEGEGAEGGGDWRALCVKLLKVLDGDDAGEGSDEELKAAIAEFTDEGPKEKDPFGDLMEGKPEKEPRPKKAGGFKDAADKAFGKEPKPFGDDEEDEDDEDEKRF